MVLLNADVQQYGAGGHYEFQGQLPPREAIVFDI